jgi:hypothetical protein
MIIPSTYFAVMTHAVSHGLELNTSIKTFLNAVLVVSLVLCAVALNVHEFVTRDMTVS